MIGRTGLHLMHRNARDRVPRIGDAIDGVLAEAKARVRVRRGDGERVDVRLQRRLDPLPTRAARIAKVGAAVAARHLEGDELIVNLGIEAGEIVLHAAHHDAFQSQLVGRRQLRLQIGIEAGGAIGLVAQLRGSWRFERA